MIAKIFTSRKALGCLFLLLLGAAKLPLESGLHQSLVTQKLLSPPPPVSMRESLGQMGFAATLGGLRSLIASITFLQAYAAWEKLEWGKVDSLMTLTTRLQPYETNYWDEASWQMAYNAASAAKSDKTLRAAIKDKLFHDYVQRGIAIAEEGLKYNPHHPKLLIRLGEIYNSSTVSGRAPNPRKSGDYYYAAAQNGAASFYERNAAYEWTKTDDPEKLQLAHQILQKYFDLGFRYPSILRDLPTLEAKLHLPQNQRIPKDVKVDEGPDRRLQKKGSS